MIWFRWWDATDIEPSAWQYTDTAAAHPTLRALPTGSVIFQPDPLAKDDCTKPTTTPICQFH
jgi:hypothetical protein